MHFRLCCLLSTEEKLCARELVHDTQTEPWTKQSVKTDHVANIPFFNFTVLAVESSFNRTSWPCSITLLSNYRIARNPTRKETNAWRNVILWLALVTSLIGILITFDFLFCVSCFLPFFRESYCLQTKLVCLFLVKTERTKFSFLLGEMLRDETKKAWLRIHARPFWSSWLLVNQRGVSGGADVTKFLEGGSCYGYSECNRVLQVDKRVSTEMSVSFCGLTCDFSKMIPLMVERKYWSKYMNALRPKIQHKFISNHISSLTVSQGSPWKKQDDKDFKTPKLKVINLGTATKVGD